MRDILILCFVVCVPYCLQYAKAQSTNAYFRKDYVFLPDTQAFYKIHTLRKEWQGAKKRCSMEGAQLFFPEDKTEVDAVIKLWNDTQSLFPSVYVGISDLLSKGDFESVDGRPVHDLYNAWGPGEPNDSDGNEDCVMLDKNGTMSDVNCAVRSPFICKKTLASLEWNAFCDMPDMSYVYNGDLGKCYKFHLNPLNWTDAYAMCSAEQSYLAIINSLQEDEYLVNVTRDAPKDGIPGEYTRGIVHLGFHNMYQEGWISIKGVPLSEVGYSWWGGGQPDGQPDELCGSMFYSGGLNDIRCIRRAFFICEHDIGLLDFDVKIDTLS